MTELIKPEDVLALLDLIAGGEEYIDDRERLVAALPAVAVGVKPLGADGVRIHPQDILNAAWVDDLGEEGLAMYDRILAALTPTAVDDSKTADPVVNDPAAIPALQARIEELVKERNDLRNFDDYFRSVCGFKRDGRDSSKCLDDFLAGINRQDTSIPFDHFLQVVKERDDLGRKLNTARYGQPDFAWSIHEQEMADLRAKLAKAVEALREIANFSDGNVVKYIQGVDTIALDVLAELEGK